ncbi:MAG: hypothetical protein VX498_02945 [Myxococcota bacterium]|nr:hypothetical protein [Myxococcota bacterium]
MLGSCLLSAACGTAQLEDEWAVSVEQLQGLPLEVTDSFPCEGSRSVGHHIQPYFLLNRPLSSEEVALLDSGSIRDLESKEPTLGRLEADEDGMGLHLRIDDLDRHHRYRLEVEVPGLATATPLSIYFATERPEGALFNMSSELRVEQFGGDPTHARLLNDIFQPGVYPLWILEVTENELGPPGSVPRSFDFLFAPGRLDSEDEAPFFLHRSYGFVGQFDEVQVAADGSFVHRQSGVFLPLWSGSEVIEIYLDTIQLRGRLSDGPGGPEVSELSLSGVLGTRSLLLMAETGPSWRAAVDGLHMDVDTNGNEIEDAATFRISSRPVSVSREDLSL